MKVKITIPCELTDNNTADISFVAELDAPILGTTMGECEVIRIWNPRIEILKGE